MKTKNYKKSKLVDVTGITASMVCIVHCLLTPMALVMLPFLSTLAMFQHDVTHMLLLGIVTPLILWTVYSVCREHGHKLCFISATAAVFALSFMTLALFFHEWETILTIIGALILMSIHFIHLYAKTKLTSSNSSIYDSNMK